jgi:autoinducer 2-degrading protein
MHKLVLISTAAAFSVLLPRQPASAQSPAPYVNLVELVVIPSELSKFLELDRDNAATAIKEPGVREFNIMQLASNPNHIVEYEVFDDEAALKAYLATDHFKKFRAAIDNMVADRNIRAMTSVEFHSNGH